MASQQLKAELTVSFKRDLPEKSEFTEDMARYFRSPSDNVALLAARTSLAGLTRSLSRVVFARDHDTTAYLYLTENVQTLKVHIESLRVVEFDTWQIARTAMKKLVNDELKNMRKFAGGINNKVDEVSVSISHGDTILSSGQGKSFKGRIIERAKANLLAKAVVPFGTAGASLLFVPKDFPVAARAAVTGIVIVIIATLVEAAMAESFEYERSD
ncbi:MAG: hypothetical protein WBR17_00950 [Paraburkholderia sp.]|uniref:hypothetical protein n=1 Tax=Paraburkholderia sp. TaxID=1926495 RepID=UPI003C61CC74